MPIFEVVVETVMVVEADNDIQASCVALANVRDNEDWTADRGNHIAALDELPAGWDGMCLPFSGDGNTRLKDILPEF